TGVDRHQALTCSTAARAAVMYAVAATSAAASQAQQRCGHASASARVARTSDQRRVSQNVLPGIRLRPCGCQPAGQVLDGGGGAVDGCGGGDHVHVLVGEGDHLCGLDVVGADADVVAADRVCGVG